MNHNQYRTMHDEDPLAGDVDKFVHPDETRTDEQIAHDERYVIEPWDDNEDDGINPEDFKKEVKNPYIITLEKSIKERALAQGLSEADIAKVDAASFLLKDADGNPTDTLKVGIGHYEGMYSRPGVEGFYLTPVDGAKDAYGRDAKFVRGSFWGCEQSEGRDCYSMSYGGGATEATREYAANALQSESLARAEVQLHMPKQE